VSVEFALTRLRGLELSEEEIDAQGLRRAWELTERLEIHLTGCQLGISSTSVLLGVVAEPAITRLIEPAVSLVGIEGMSVRAVSVTVAVVLLNLVHKIWGEQAPTYLGVERPREVARYLAPPLAVWSTLMSPVIRLGDGLAKATLRPFGVEITRSWLAAEESEVEEEGEAMTAGEARSDLTRRMADLLAGEVPEDRRDEVLQALRIDEIPAADIMIPAEEIIWLHLDDDPETQLRRIGEHGHVRYPVLREGSSPEEASMGDVRGFLYVPALFGGDGGPREGSRDLPSLLAPPFHLPADLPVSRLIDRLQDESQELTLLTDPDDEDRVVGLVTVSDAFEVIAGDLQDPLDRTVPGADGS
jgi:CBS domain containing-hemolysin-like protein